MQTPVCNLTVEGLHTFAVGEMQALVHNSSGTVGEPTGGEWVRPRGWRLPKNGTWEGTPGNSNFIPNNPAELGLKPGEVSPSATASPTSRSGRRATSRRRKL